MIVGGTIMTDRVNTITTLLNSLPNRDAIFSLLHQKILDRYPATDGKSDCKKNCVVRRQYDYISVSFPSSPHLQPVSAFGLELLALTGLKQGVKIHKILLGDISPSLLLLLASLEGEPITEMKVDWNIDCNTEEEGLARVSLLERSNTWELNTLALYGEVGGQAWERLAREVAKLRSARLLGHYRGYFGTIYTESELVRRGKREDLLAVWEEIYVAYVDREEEEFTWQKIEEIIQ